MNSPTHSDIVKLFDSHGYELNLDQITPFGIRSKDWDIDEWEDTLGIIYKDLCITAAGTTKPGKSPLTKTENVNENGIFILRPNLYKNCLQKGKHKGKYNALVQFGFGNFEGWRDNDHDGLFDINAVLWRDVKGCNFHGTREDKTVVRVGDFSEGCQVVHLWEKFDLMMEVVYKSEQALFNYALFQE
jgi:hypothetical protein